MFLQLRLVAPQIQENVIKTITLCNKCAKENVEIRINVTVLLGKAQILENMYILTYAKEFLHKSRVKSVELIGFAKKSLKNSTIPI